MIRVADSDHIKLSIKKHTLLAKLFTSVCRHWGITNSNSVRFCFDGDVLKAEQTADSAGLENEDQVELV